MVDRNGIEPFLQACKARVPPTTPTAHNFQRTVSNACIKAHQDHKPWDRSHVNLYGTDMLWYAVIFCSTRRTPSYRPPICSFECCRLALPCTKRKTPGFLVPGSFVFYLRLDSWNLLSYTGPLTTGNTIHGRKPTWPGLCLAHCGIQRWMFQLFHHKSYCTLFTSRGQPRIVFQVLYLYNTPFFWLRWKDSNLRSPGYEPGQIPLLTHRANQLQLFIYRETHWHAMCFTIVPKVEITP